MIGDDDESDCAPTTFERRLIIASYLGFLAMMTAIVASVATLR